MPSDPTLYLYTSLTAGSSHIITATSRIETILKANKIPFKAVDCATDDKARMLWARRSKGRKIPGLVKFNDVIADLEQVEEWNEYGELEDQIEDQIDIFGDVPISGTSAEAHETAAARAKASAEASQRAKEQAAQDEKNSTATGQGRTASETRHISISEPKKGSVADEKKDTPLSMAMRQAGAEAAAKAGQKKSMAGGVEEIRVNVGQRKEPIEPEKVVVPLPSDLKPVKLEPESQEVEKVDTGAKTPGQLVAEGSKKSTVDKLSSSEDEDPASTTKSKEEQILDQKRKSSVPATPSGLAKTTSIDESHTVASSGDKTSPKPSQPATKEHRGSSLDPSDQEKIKEIEKANAIKEEEEEDDEDEDSDEGEEDEDASEEEEKVKVPATKAAKVGATDSGEKKVLLDSKPQDHKAADGDKAGVSVGD